MEPISKRYRENILKMMGASQGEAHVSEHNVYQPGNKAILPFIESIIEENLLPGSELRHPERIAELIEASKRGEPCLLLLEHYSNFDLPVFCYLLAKALGAEAAEAIVAIAGIKLNESNPVVLAFTEAYSRIVIYPSRSIEGLKEALKDPKEYVAELMRSTTVNRAAMKSLAEVKTSGKLILVFPSGTRFRPWDPATKRGLREIDSYLKSFSKMCLVSINGNILRINPEGEMQEDLVCQDRLVLDASPLIDCAEFRERAKKEHKAREERKLLHEDKKQAIVDALMAILSTMHDEVEKTRL
jgi:glycerol-3-phosphate O-acyltransferase